MLVNKGKNQPSLTVLVSNLRLTLISALAVEKVEWNLLYFRLQNKSTVCGPCVRSSEQDGHIQWICCTHNLY